MSFLPLLLYLLLFLIHIPLDQCKITKKSKGAMKAMSNSTISKIKACKKLPDCAMRNWKEMCMEVKERKCAEKSEICASKKVCAKLKIDTNTWYETVVPTDVCVELEVWLRMQCKNGTKMCPEMGVTSQNVCTQGGLIGGCVKVDTLDGCMLACANVGGTKQVCEQVCSCTDSHIFIKLVDFIASNDDGNMMNLFIKQMQQGEQAGKKAAKAKENTNHHSTTRKNAKLLGDGVQILLKWWDPFETHPRWVETDIDRVCAERKPDERNDVVSHFSICVPGRKLPACYWGKMSEDVCHVVKNRKLCVCANEDDDNEDNNGLCASTWIADFWGATFGSHWYTVCTKQKDAKKCMPIKHDYGKGVLCVETKTQELAYKVLKASACKNLPVYKTNWNEMYKEYKEKSCKEIKPSDEEYKYWACKNEICAIEDTKQGCVNVLEETEWWHPECKESGNIELCKRERKSKVCATDFPPVSCFNMLEEHRRNCTKGSRSIKKWCETESTIAATMGRWEKKVCTDGRKQWQECIGESKKEECTNSEEPKERIKGLLAAWACKKLPACDKDWNEMCADMDGGYGCRWKERTDVKVRDTYVECQNKGKLCAKVDTEEMCVNVLEETEWWHPECKESGNIELCKRERKSKVCATEFPELCVDVLEEPLRNCTKWDTKKLCKTEGTIAAKMGTEEVCMKKREQWQECSMNENTKRNCIWDNNCKRTQMKDQCEQFCTQYILDNRNIKLIAEECTKLQRPEELNKRQEVEKTIEGYGKLLKGSACKNLPPCQTSWEDMCKNKNELNCRDEGFYSMNKKCQNEGQMCAKVGTEEVCFEVLEDSSSRKECELCAEVIEELGWWTPCTEPRKTDLCEREVTRKVCLKERTTICLEMVEKSKMNCTKESTKISCKREGTISAKMGTEEVCTVMSDPLEECSVNEDKKKVCVENWCTSSDSMGKELCVQKCTVSAEECMDSQEIKALEHIKEVGKMLKASVCKDLSASNPDWKEMFKGANKGKCAWNRTEWKCERENMLCAKVETKEVCAKVLEHSTLEQFETFKEWGFKKEKTRKVCAKGSPKMCVEVLELAIKKCKKEGAMKWCNTRTHKEAMMGTEELCKNLQHQWHECSMNEGMKKSCMEKCAKAQTTDTGEKYPPKEQCEQYCALMAEGCSNKECKGVAKCIKDTDCGENGWCAGVELGKCDCLTSECINKEKCDAKIWKGTSCGGLKGACNTTSNECDCDMGYRNAGFKDTYDALHNFCAIKECDGNSTDACFGYPCRTGKCVCGYPRRKRELGAIDAEGKMSLQSLDEQTDAGLLANNDEEDDKPHPL